jgi:hypothetical protein
MRLTMIRSAAVALAVALLAGCTYVPPAPTYAYVPCPAAPAAPVAPPGAPPPQAVPAPADAPPPGAPAPAAANCVVPVGGYGYPYAYDPYYDGGYYPYPYYYPPVAVGVGVGFGHRFR